MLLLSALSAFLLSLSIPFALFCVFNLDPPPEPPTAPAPAVPVRKLRSTLDSKHWALDESKRPFRRSLPPIDHSRAPVKPRAPSPVSDTIPSRVLFSSPLAGAHSAGGSGVVPSTSAGRAPPASTTGSSGGPLPVTLGAPTLSPIFSIADSVSEEEKEDVTVIHHSSDRSFFEDFPPPGLSGSDLIAGSTPVLHTTASVINTTASALNTTASAVRQMFSSDSARTQPSGSACPARDIPPSRDNPPPRDNPDPRDNVPALPSREQFTELQRQYATLQRHMDDLLNRRTADQQARDIDEDFEARRKIAYEAAGLCYQPRPPAFPNAPPAFPRQQEYRISHKSIGYLRPADASLKPFDAVEGEVYVRPLAWLAHLRTKLDLKEDFQYKNQVLQVASECLVGRAAAWWTAIGQRMCNILLTDYTLDQWNLQMQVLCQSREQTRKTAAARSWLVDREECWDYVWNKAALFEELDPRDRPTGVSLISEILDGLPSSLARMCRTEFSPNPTVSDLTRELQVLVPRWRHDNDFRERDRPRRPAPFSSRGIPPAESLSRPADLPSRGVHSADSPSIDRPPLSSSYDPSKIGSRTHPVTKKLTRCYTKPNGKTIFLNRHCSRCREAHFDFEHDSLSASARFGFDESGYEEWDYDSDTVNGDSSSSLWVAQHSSPPWSDDAAASAPDWRLSSKETVLKQSQLWHPREDAWLRDKKPLSASDRAHKSMDLHLQRNHDTELRELRGVVPTSSPEMATDSKTFCAWVARSMPTLPWPSLDDNWDLQYHAFFSRHRPRVPPRSISHSWSPPPNDGCRHPDDHVIVASPGLPVQEDGRCFLRSTPTFFRPRVGSSRAPRTRALLDNCANLCLANKTFLLRCMPAITIHEEFTTGVDGIGSARTVGYVHAPIYIDCMSRVGGKIGKVELNLEIHLIDGLSVDLIVGMDAICAYGIDTIISRSIATLSVCNRDLAFPIEFRRSHGMRDPHPDGFSVICRNEVVIPPLHEAPVTVVTGLGSIKGDAWLHPVHVKNDNRLWSPMDGGWVADGLVRPDQPHVLFANMSTRPIRLRRGQLIGRLTLCGTHDCFGSSTVVHSPACHAATIAAPRSFSCVPKRQGSSQGIYEAPPSPASLIDPHNRDPSGITAPHTEQSFDISSTYGRNNSPQQCIVRVLEDHRNAFSFDGKPAIVDSVRIPIVTDDTRLFAEAPHQVGPHKRQIFDASIDQLLDWDVIEPSDSRVGYPVVLVKQHDKWRFCVDYRNLNLATTGHVYPMARTDSIFDALHGKSVFSILDTARGYHQLPIAEGDRWKTASLLIVGYISISECHSA